MGLKEELAEEIESTRRDFHRLLDSVPGATYVHPSHNPAWTNGDVLYHIAVGLTLIHYEVWLTLHARGLLQFGLNLVPAKILHRINAGFARRGNRINRQTLIKAYEAGHSGLISSLTRMREDDFGRWVSIPTRLDIILSGKVTVKRLFQHVKIHFEKHVRQVHRDWPGVADKTGV